MVQRSNLPYDALRDFTPVMHAGFFDSALVVNASRPYNTVSELVDYARANPDKVNWGHFGLNSTGYMYMQYLNKNRGVRLFPVPYKTQPQNILALVAGDSDVTLTSFNTIAPHVKAGVGCSTPLRMMRKRPGFSVTRMVLASGKATLNGWTSPPAISLTLMRWPLSVSKVRGPAPASNDVGAGPCAITGGAIRSSAISAASCQAGLRTSPFSI
jgi:hypothetical protein